MEPLFDQAHPKSIPSMLILQYVSTPDQTFERRDSLWTKQIQVHDGNIFLAGQQQ